MLTAALTIIFHGLAFAMVLYIVSVGLGITMGLMNFANLAHGAFAAAGGYVVVVATKALGWPFWAALPAAFVVVALTGAVIERLVVRTLYGADELRQVLFSIALLFMAIAGFTLAFGPLQQQPEIPAALSGQIGAGGLEFPAYRSFVIVAGVLILGALWLLIGRTRMGMRIRAAVDNRNMAEAIGVDTKLLFTMTFALGTGIAGLGGGIGADVLSITPTYGQEYLVLFLIVVAVGGLGSIFGPFVAALCIGIVDVAGKYLIPEFGAFFIYGVVIAILLAKPAGLFGVRS
ncbi:branched-chain amino acid ABC transporter permease [Azospirillum canadense]|uniref:branched-chain amino acid ABC transporter permease n=1 Tax=Azospirillum canadense TaxID=403962 RepID=UPI00222606EB|nr:branched-chain amino acid ABC transporter permease [Azospirillum canadense]MCW2241989.1 branched-chain amino acid transport system permease protein [Azospirillum canadense]